MFEDFKEKVGKLQNKNDSEIHPMSTALAPEITEKVRKHEIDPDNFTMKQLFPESLDGDGNDLSLMSGAEWEIMITYCNQKTLTRLTSQKHKTTHKEKSFITPYSNAIDL